jgi:hypothetical protein
VAALEAAGVRVAATPSGLVGELRAAWRS